MIFERTAEKSVEVVRIGDSERPAERVARPAGTFGVGGHVSRSDTAVDPGNSRDDATSNRSTDRTVWIALRVPAPTGGLRSTGPQHRIRGTLCG
jgi:hypothetical protein